MTARPPDPRCRFLACGRPLFRDDSNTARGFPSGDGAGQESAGAEVLRISRFILARGSAFLASPLTGKSRFQAEFRDQLPLRPKL